MNDISIKINKKITLFVVATLTFFSAADFISLFDSDSLRMPEVEQMTIGSVVLRMDNTNPSEIYGGSWRLIDGDAIMTLGDGSNLSGAIIGTNEKTVPLPEHSHSFVGNALPAHAHNQRANGGDGGSGNSFGGHAVETKHGYATRQLSLTTGTATSGTPSGTISSSGSDNVSIDLREARIAINVWQKIS